MTAQTRLPGAENKRPGLFYGYIIVIAAFITTLVVYGAQYSFGVFFKPLLAEFGWTRAATSGAFSLNIVLGGVSGLFAGRLNDRFGPRVVVTACGLLLGSGYLLMPQVQAIWQIYLFYGVLVGVGACVYVPLMSTPVRWFVKRRGVMSGIVIAGVGAGITIVPPLANQLINSYNWRTAYVILGLGALVLTVIAAQFLKRDPGQIGQAAYGEREIQTGKTPTNMQGFSLREAVRTGQLWLICGILFLANYCIQTVMVHIVPHATDTGIPAVKAAYILSAIGLLSIGSKVGMGGVADKVGNKRVMVAVLILMSGGFIWLRSASELWMLYFFTIVFALAYGGYAAVPSPMVAEYFGLKSHGAIFGTVYLSFMVGGAIGPLAAGRIFDVTASYNLAFIACAVLSVIGLLLLVPLKRLRS